MSADGQRTKWPRKSSENFNRLSRAHECYRQTTDDRQTTDRQTDGRTTTYSERELEFTFAKNFHSFIHSFYYCSTLLFSQSIIVHAVYRSHAVWLITTHFMLFLFDKKLHRIPGVCLLVRIRRKMFQKVLGLNNQLNSSTNTTCSQYKNEKETMTRSSSPINHQIRLKYT